MESKQLKKKKGKLVADEKDENFKSGKENVFPSMMGTMKLEAVGGNLSFQKRMKLSVKSIQSKNY
jgi:hypothetical protein